MLSVHAADPEQGLNLALSAVVGYVSLVCWMVVMFPQIYMNYQRKSGEGVSLVMMIAWVCGDIFNITGAL
ncbi:putative vacuolar membrane transporter for cationic amino acids, partial [Coemansia sp. D1744]